MSLRDKYTQVKIQYVTVLTTENDSADNYLDQLNSIIKKHPKQTSTTFSQNCQIHLKFS